MIVGTHTAQNPINLVLKAPKDLAFSIDIKRQRVREGHYTVLGRIEQIIFENDKSCSYDTPDARKVGRRLYWPQAESQPWIGVTRPEEDLVIPKRISLPLPRVPDASVLTNPYLVDEHGISHLRSKQKPLEAPKIQQRIERIASAKYRNFLVFHPVAQIILMMPTRSGLTFGAMGSHRLPLSSLSGFDGRKMSLLLDPFTGEAFLNGGRYAYPFAVEGESQKATDAVAGNAGMRKLMSTSITAGKR